MTLLTKPDLKRHFRLRPSSQSPSENGGSLYDSDSLRSRGSRGSERRKLSEVNYGIQRLLDDLGKKKQLSYRHRSFRGPHELCIMTISIMALSIRIYIITTLGLMTHTA